MAISTDLGAHLESAVNELVNKGRWNSKSEVPHEGVATGAGAKTAPRRPP